MLAASFWEIFWYIVIAFLLLNVIVVFFAIAYDVIRDDELGGAMKALWIVLLLLFPIVSMIVYLITRGGSIGRRTLAIEQAKAAAVPPPPTTMNPASEIAQAKQLLDSGAITQDEFDTMKRRILG